MNNNSNRIRAALSAIAEMASSALAEEDGFEETEHTRGHAAHAAAHDDARGCVIKSLPTRLLVKAADTARRINPTNAPVLGPLASAGEGFQVAEPLKIAVLTSKYWGPKPRQITVSFMEQTPADLKTRIIGHLNAWTRTGCISFVGTGGAGDVRISRGAGGYWSYLGTDILHIPRNRQTMNLEGFSTSTPESEYKRVVRHETGHTLGFPHEHMRKALVARIDAAKAYKWFMDEYGWDRATVDAQVLTPLDEASLMGTPADQDSIMCYQLPGLITKDGKPIVGGTDIDAIDAAFCGKIYPKPGGHNHRGRAPEEEWSEAEDVEVAGV